MDILEEIDAPLGYVKFSEICSTLFKKGKNWDINGPTSWVDLYTNPRNIFLGDGLNLPMISLRNEIAKLWYALIRDGLKCGYIEAVGLIIDELRLVTLSRHIWSIPQRRVSQNFGDLEDPFANAIAGDALRILPRADTSPVVFPLISESALARLFHAKQPPSEPDDRPLQWTMWLEGFRAASGSWPSNNQRSRSARRTNYDWRPVWHEVVRRAMRGELHAVTLPELTESMADWMAVALDQYPDETSIRAQLKGIFDDTVAEAELGRRAGRRTTRGRTRS